MAAQLVLFLLVLTSSTAAARTNILRSGERLPAGGLLEYEEAYVVAMHEDCDLALYDFVSGATELVWETNTGGQAGDCYLLMQDEGNLAVYAPDGRPVWASNTARSARGNYLLVLQGDRNLVVYSPEGTPNWATGTNTRVPININSTSHHNNITLPDSSLLVRRVDRATS